MLSRLNLSKCCYRNGLRFDNRIDEISQLPNANKRQGISLMSSIRFLCGQHREWLMESAERAESYWSQWAESAEVDVVEMTESARISHAGCAWELSGEILQNEAGCAHKSMDRFSRSSLQLMRLLFTAGLIKIANDVGDACDRALCALVADDDKREGALFCLQVLQSQRSQWAEKSLVH